MSVIRSGENHGTHKKTDGTFTLSDTKRNTGKPGKASPSIGASTLKLIPVCIGKMPICSVRCTTIRIFMNKQKRTRL